MRQTCTSYTQWSSLALFLMLGSCTSTTQENGAVKKQVSSKVTELLGGIEVVSVIQNSDSVSAFLLPQKSFHQKTLDSYTMRLGPVKLNDSQRTQFVDLLLSKRSYLFDVAKGCEPDYGVRIEFLSGEDRVDVLLCFGCSQLQIYRNGQSLAGGPFDPAAKDLTEFVKEIFPDDELIQTL